MDKILNEKELIISKGTQILDLISPSYDLGMDRVEVKTVGLVTSQMESRGDIFAQVYSNNFEDEYEILKFNRISNPFSIKEGDYLGIPKLNQLGELKITMSKRAGRNYSENSKEKIYDEVRKQYNPFPKDNIKSTTFDAFKNKYSRLEELKNLQKAKELQQGDSTDSSSLLPPNFADKNKKEITVTPNGTVILGESVAGTATSCGKNSVSKAELLNTILKNRVVR